MDINILFLILGFIFTSFVPGFLIIETFFKELPGIQKLPFYLLLSVLVSTYVVYLLSLAIGYSRYSILLSLLIFVPWLVFMFAKRSFQIKIACRSILKHSPALAISLVIFALFLVALYPGIFTRYQDYFVMSSLNWQDTAMHQSIIESIVQGNFPPQAPYFSGQPLNYYYFVDFHSAILVTLFGQFFPRILVYDNPFFAMIFFLSVYALSYYFSENKLVGIISGLLAIFCSNFLYFRFFRDIILASFTNHINFLATVRDLIMNSGERYTFAYGQLMQVPPMVNYLLQNRPMMVGLPAIALLILLLMHGFDTNKGKYFILASLLTGMMIKFQLFAFGVSILIFLLSILILRNRNFKEVLQKFVYFFGPLAIFLILTSLLFKNNSYFIQTFLNSFRFGPWDRTKDFLWYLSFPFANLGILFFLFLIAIVLVISKKIKLTRKIRFIFMLAVVLCLIPYFICFSIYEADMIKFYYFLIIPLSLVSGFFLQKISRVSYLGQILMISLIIISSFGSYLTLGWSFFDKREAYSQAEYQVGIWIRNNTLPNLVFITMPSVHSAVSEIGGRPRVLAYINWGYSHGFNKGEDSVFTRQADIESIYKNPMNIGNTKMIFGRYRADYIYVGAEEKSLSPAAQSAFDKQDYLQLVYDWSGIKIYKII